MADLAARHVLPPFTELAAHGPRTTNPSAQLLSERVVFLCAPIDDASANEVATRLILLEQAAPGQDIRLCINGIVDRVTGSRKHSRPQQGG